MQAEQDALLQHILAKLLMLETIQTSLLTFIADQTPTPADAVEKIIGDTENELRLLAIAEIDHAPSSGPIADLALKYLAESAHLLKSTLRQA